MGDGEQTLEVSWLSPDPPNGLIIGYNITWREKNDSIVGQTYVQTSPTNMTNLTISKLYACRLYIVNVIASTSAGAGPPAIDSSYTRPNCVTCAL